MNLIPWSPFRELDQLLSRYARNGFGSMGEGNLQWRPTADITENDKEYLIKVDLPEVKKDDIEISVENGVLTLSGERKVEKSAGDEKEHRRETFYGRFERSFALPEDVDQEKISAECRDGVLKVHLPKSEAKKPRSIQVNVS
ncbi:MAG TPA: Hsp20/alpha crystallin family protein [Gammaproteobacteria bacterium]|nr:Hsp20/alpha crystallin family protein [Gammaproteobacteria bacterium]